jgi:non-heme chloroperoxidase
MIKDHMITGGGGVRLHVVEDGNPHGPSILFLHGFSQCSLAWERQMRSELQRRYRLIAMDLRGHGSSERPTDGYDDSRLWADDIDATIRELELDRPVVCGWSYGPLVILDYIRFHGEERIGGIHFVDALTKLGSETALSVLTAELLALVPGFFSTDVGESILSLQSLLGLCFAREPDPAELYTMLGYEASVPPFVRKALFSRVIDNDALMRTITTPVLITHGANDRVVRKEAVELHCAQLAHAEIDIMPGAGHAPFWDDPDAFNRRLASFRESCVAIDATPRTPRR